MAAIMPNLQRPGKRLTVAFDASCLTSGPKTGVAYYTESLVLALARNYPEIELIGHYCNFMGRQRHNLPQAPNIRYRPSYIFSQRAVNMLRRLGVSIPFELLTKIHADFHLFPAFIGWPSIWRTPSAAVIHDLAYLEMPETVSQINQKDLSRLVPLTLRRSRLAIAVSHTTEVALRHAYGPIVPQTVVTRIPPITPAAVSGQDAQRVRSELGVHGKYLLYVGTLEPRKNIIGLIAAYSLLPAHVRHNYSLVLAGGLGWNSSEISLALKEAAERKLNIMHAGYVSEKQKAALYKAAALLVQPSFYEGFGMPILEAMASGVPVIASDIPIFHEVGSDAVLYADPHSPEALAASITRILSDAQLYIAQQQKGTNLIRHYPSWDDVATKVYQAMARTLQSN